MSENPEAAAAADISTSPSEAIVRQPLQDAEEPMPEVTQNGESSVPSPPLPLAMPEEEEGNDDAVPSNDLFVDNRGSETELIQAARANDHTRIRQLVQAGQDINAPWEGTPCMVNVRRENFRNQLQMRGYAPLHVAAIHSSVQTVKYLLSLGADVNLRDKNQRTALQLACAVNRPSMAQALIAAGADVNTRSASGRSPLMEAALGVSVDLTRLLLAAQADPDITDIKGTTPLYATIGSMAGLNKSVWDGQDIVRCLINAKCQVDKTNPAGASALMFAAGLKNIPVIHMLVEAGADVNLADRSGRTPFHMASEGQRNLSAVRVLMQYGAATHTADNRGETVLSKALKFGSISLLRLLLEADAAPHSYDILTAPRVVQLRQYLPEFDQWLLAELYQPRTLRRLCREVVRLAMTPRSLPFVPQLGLPTTLADFVLGEGI